MEGIARCKSLGTKRFGIHTMIVSNELNCDYLAETLAQMMFNLAVKIKNQLGVSVEVINLGGGIGIPYRPGARSGGICKVFGNRVKEAYESILIPAGLTEVAICIESGRMMTGPYGYLVSTAIHYKEYL